MSASIKEELPPESPPAPDDSESDHEPSNEPSPDTVPKTEFISRESSPNPMDDQMNWDANRKIDLPFRDDTQFEEINKMAEENSNFYRLVVEQFRQIYDHYFREGGWRIVFGEIFDKNFVKYYHFMGNHMSDQELVSNEGHVKKPLRKKFLIRKGLKDAFRGHTSIDITKELKCWIHRKNCALVMKQSKTGGTSVSNLEEMSTPIIKEEPPLELPHPESYFESLNEPSLNSVPKTEFIETSLKPQDDYMSLDLHWKIDLPFRDDTQFEEINKMAEENSNFYRLVVEQFRQIYGECFQKGGLRVVYDEIFDKDFVKYYHFMGNHMSDQELVSSEGHVKKPLRKKILIQKGLKDAFPEHKCIEIVRELKRWMERKRIGFRKMQHTLSVPQNQISTLPSTVINNFQHSSTIPSISHQQNFSNTFLLISPTINTINSHQPLLTFINNFVEDREIPSEHRIEATPVSNPINYIDDPGPVEIPEEMLTQIEFPIESEVHFEHVNRDVQQSPQLYDQFEYECQKIYKQKIKNGGWGEIFDGILGPGLVKYYHMIWNVTKSIKTDEGVIRRPIREKFLTQRLLPDAFSLYVDPDEVTKELQDWFKSRRQNYMPARRLNPAEQKEMEDESRDGSIKSSKLESGPPAIKYFAAEKLTSKPTAKMKRGRPHKDQNIAVKTTSNDRIRRIAPGPAPAPMFKSVQCATTSNEVGPLAFFSSANNFRKILPKETKLNKIRISRLK